MSTNNSWVLIRMNSQSVIYADNNNVGVGSSIDILDAINFMASNNHACRD